MKKHEWQNKQEWLKEYKSILTKVSKYPTGDGTVKADNGKDVYIFLQEAYLVPGLCAEAGEIASMYAKSIRDDNGDVDDDYIDKMALELGDVLFFVQSIASLYGFDLENIAAANAAKLLDRLNRGVIGGSGDNR